MHTLFLLRNHIVHHLNDLLWRSEPYLFFILPYKFPWITSIFGNTTLTIQLWPLSPITQEIFPFPFTRVSSTILPHLYLLFLSLRIPFPSTHLSIFTHSFPPIYVLLFTSPCHLWTDIFASWNFLISSLFSLHFLLLLISFMTVFRAHLYSSLIPSDLFCRRRPYVSHLWISSLFLHSAIHYPFFLFSFILLFMHLSRSLWLPSLNASLPASLPRSRWVRII